jgi:hypothetical protein
LKTNNCLIFVIILVAMVACSKSSFKRYEPYTVYPKAIYVENQINKIWTEGKIAADKSIYVDVRMQNGIKKSGKLIEISKEYVVLTEGYYYASDNNNNIFQLDKDETNIPKSEILILKIW